MAILLYDVIICGGTLIIVLFLYPRKAVYNITIIKLYIHLGFVLYEKAEGGDNFSTDDLEELFLDSPLEFYIKVMNILLLGSHQIFMFSNKMKLAPG